MKVFLFTILIFISTSIFADSDIESATKSILNALNATKSFQKEIKPKCLNNQDTKQESSSKMPDNSQILKINAQEEIEQTED